VESAQVRFSVCEICGANFVKAVDLGWGTVQVPPAEVPEQCKLKEHSVGNGCIAFRSPERAKELLQSQE